MGVGKIAPPQPTPSKSNTMPKKSGMTRVEINISFDQNDESRCIQLTV